MLYLMQDGCKPTTSSENHIFLQLPDDFYIGFFVNGSCKTVGFLVVDGNRTPLCCTKMMVIAMVILYCAIRNDTYYTILYYTILYYIKLFYHTILYHTILYYNILYYTILYYTILYCTVLYCTVLYYTILYYIILYYNIMKYNII